MSMARNVCGSVRAGSRAGVGALQSVFGVRFDPRPQRHDRDPS
jgi:hypothetical protein